MSNSPNASLSTPVVERAEVRRLSDLSSQQWKSGIAAWLGWLFDGLDSQLYLLVAAPFVAQLLNITDTSDPQVKFKSAIIQGAFLWGWALGGGFFGRLGDILGRSRALSLTILTYSIFTGMSFFAHAWWQLLILRFVAALGIGGEWAVGSSLLSETWPRKWSVWIAAVLQTGTNIGILIACLAVFLITGSLTNSTAHMERYVFLVGVIPGFMVFWIRRSVGEPEEWHAAKNAAGAAAPKMSDLFKGDVLRTTILTILVCAFSLTAWWAFMFWHVQELRALPELASWTAGQKSALTTSAFFLLIAVSMPGNFFAGWLAKLFGYRRAIALMFVGFAISIAGGYCVQRSWQSLLFWIPCVGFFSGVFGLFTMYLPPLFPVLLRTTGAGFCYNIGRLAAGAGTVFFGYLSIFKGGFSDLRPMIFADAFLFIPAIFVALMMPDWTAEQHRES